MPRLRDLLDLLVQEGNGDVWVLLDIKVCFYLVSVSRENCGFR